MSVRHKQAIILFVPINAAGHINSSVAIADRLRADHGHQTVFLLVGPPPSGAIVSHGHKLVQLEEAAPYEDYDIEDDEDTSKPVDVELKRRQGKTMRKFEGAAKWPQVTARHEHLFKSKPLEIYKNCAQLACKFIHADLIANNDQVGRAIMALDPDLIVSDSYLPHPLVLLQEKSRPWVRLLTSNPISVTRPSARANPAGLVLRPTSRLGTKLERERIRAEEPERWQSMLAEWRRIDRELGSAFSQSYEMVRHFYQTNGCGQRLAADRSSISSPYLNIYMYPEALDYHQDDDLLEYPPGWLRCDSLIGAPRGRPEEEELRRWSGLLESRLRGRRPEPKLVYFSLGSIASGNLKSMTRFMRILAEDREQRLYVVSKGVNGQRYELNEHNMIGADYIPQTLFLKRAQLAIIHGGNNSITECLYYGVPVIVLPTSSDQFDNAQRIEDLGLGRALDVNECTADQLLGAIGDLLADQPLKARLETISKQMQARDELAKVSHVLGRLVEEKRLDENLARKYDIRLE